MRRLLLAGLFLVAPPAAAQAGTVVWSLRGTLPDSMPPVAAGLSEIDLMFTFATDGSRLGMQMTIGPIMAASVVAMDLSTARIQVVTNAAGDSLAIGVVFPPEISAQMGGGIGYRLDFEVPDSFAFPVLGLDSLLAAASEDDVDGPEAINTGQTDTVAGIPCEIWTMATGDDSSPGLPMITMCLAESVPALTAINDLTKRLLPDFGFDLEELQTRSWNHFGGRELIPVRMMIGDDGEQFVFQLEQASSEAPDAAFFTLPEGLQPFPIEALQGMMGGMPQADAQES
jgi:hypothetical protein